MNTQQFLELRPGRKYTLWFFSEFGFPCTAHIKLQDIKIEPYSKYDETVTLLFIPRGKKTVKDIHVIPGRILAVWPSWLTVDAEKYAEDLQPGIEEAIKAARVKPIALNLA